MAAPEYDFFATGPRRAPAGAATDGFSTPAAPHAQVRHAAGPVLPEAPAVNQFGLPVDAAVPTGPLAAPGYGAAPVHGGITAGYDDAPAAWDPAASVAARSHSRESAPPPDMRPGAVAAAGIIAIVLGVLGTLSAAFIFFGYLAAKSEVDAAIAASGPELEGLGELTSSILTGVLVMGFVVAAISVLYVVLGVMTARGRRWAAWTLVVLSALSLVGSLYQTLGAGSGGAASGVGSWLGIATMVAVLLLLTIGEGGRWLRRS